jgi:hypothetical protein
MRDKGIGQNYLVNTTLRLLTLKEYEHSGRCIESETTHILGNTS